MKGWIGWIVKEVCERGVFFRVIFFFLKKRKKQRGADLSSVHLAARGEFKFMVSKVVSHRNGW